MPGPSVSIRKARLGRVFLDDLVANGTMTPELAAFLTAAVAARKNIMIAGATNAGKTTLLRALANEIPPWERLVTVERALELGLGEFQDLHPNVVAFEERLPNSEGLGGVTMAELVRRSLRMNPSRVIVGEVLGDEIVTMLNAMSQGNDGSLSTIHANSSLEVFNRIATYAIQASERLPIEATQMLIAGALDFVVFLRKRNDYAEGGGWPDRRERPRGRRPRRAACCPARCSHPTRRPASLSRTRRSRASPSSRSTATGRWSTAVGLVVMQVDSLARLPDPGRPSVPGSSCSCSSSSGSEPGAGGRHPAAREPQRPRPARWHRQRAPRGRHVPGGDGGDRSGSCSRSRSACWSASGSASSAAPPRSERRSSALEGLAAWTEALRDTIAGAVGLEQAIPATTVNAAPVDPAQRSTCSSTGCGSASRCRTR